MRREREATYCRRRKGIRGIRIITNTFEKLRGNGGGEVGSELET